MIASDGVCNLIRFRRHSRKKIDAAFIKIMPLYSHCGMLPFGLGKTKAENSGICDVNTVSNNEKCTVDDAYSSVTTREQCVVDVWNIFTMNSSSCHESRDNISRGQKNLHTDMMMNAIAHCETHPEVWASISNSLKGCPSESQLLQAFTEHNGPDLNSLKSPTPSNTKVVDLNSLQLPASSAINTVD